MATLVTRNSATIIDNIFLNNFINREISTGILKANISDLFSIFNSKNLKNQK